MSEFIVDVPIKVTSGWGVVFLPSWEGEEESEQLADVESAVVRVARETVVVTSGGRLCVDTDFGLLPAEEIVEREDLAQDDTHDFRPRLFPTEAEAVAHRDYTMDRWRNPCVWESFVVFS